MATYPVSGVLLLDDSMFCICTLRLRVPFPKYGEYRAQAKPRLTLLCFMYYGVTGLACSARSPIRVHRGTQFPSLTPVKILEDCR